MLINLINNYQGLQPDNLGLSERDASKFAAWLPYGHLDIIDQDNPKWFHTVDAFMLRSGKFN